ncbi:MAG: hypothetical protein FWE82_01035 [Defluviitaleaceae bacterium]|nr:hypothetical protein [Defluviitaleaceae bacterium]
MEPITVSVARPKDLKGCLAFLNAEVKKYGLEFNGDEKRGTASGRGFAGKYEVFADSVVLTVTKKPAFVPASFVEKNIKKYCEDYLRSEG